MKRTLKIYQALRLHRLESECRWCKGDKCLQHIGEDFILASDINRLIELLEKEGIKTL